MADTPPTWKTLTGVDLSKVESAAQTVDDVSAVIADFLTAVSSILRVVAALIPGDADLITSLVNAAIDTLEAMILDLLQNNIAVAFHVNLTWDHSWVVDLETLPFDQRGGRANWKEGRDWPYSANGIDGWLLDIDASSRDKSDPFRPLTDDDTTVAGFIYVIGAASFDDIGDIVALFDALTDFSDLSETIEQTVLDGMAKGEAISLAGEAMFSEKIRDWFSDEAGEYVVDVVLEATTLSMTGRSVRGVRRSGYPSLWPGSSRPVHELLEKMRALVDALRMPTEDPLVALAELLAYKAEILANLALEIGDIIQQLLSLATLLEGGNFVWIQVGPLDQGTPNSDTGGMSSFIAQAIAGEDKPDLGSDAIFGGIVGVVTVDNPISHLQAFWDLIGVSIDEYSETQTTRADQIEDTIDGISFSP